MESTTDLTTVSTTPLITLDAPADLSVNENVIDFSPVENALKYRIKVRHILTETISYYNITDGFNLRLILSDGSYAIAIMTTGVAPYQDSAYSDEILVTISDPNQISTLEEEDLENYQFIRWSGRTAVDELNDSVKFYFTASGFEVGFYGTQCSARILASKTDIAKYQPILSIFLDGEENPLEATDLILDAADKTYTLVSGLEMGYHRLKVLKRSEAIDSNTALKSLSTDGYFADPGSPNTLRFQFIAASSSTGYGNLDINGIEGKTTRNSNGLIGFAYLVSYMLDAECSIFAASGWGVTRGYNTGGQINTTENIPNAFDYVGINDTNKVLTDLGKWNVSNYTPDVIVVNLGTNDFNASGYDSMSAEQKTALEERFITDYTAFILKLNNAYPNAEIIVSYGLMGEALKLGGFTNQIVANAQEVTNKVHVFQMEAAGSNQIPYGSNYHPSVQTHIRVADAMVNFILQLTDYEKVRNNIVWED